MPSATALLLRALLLAGLELVPDRAETDFSTPVGAPAGSAVVAEAASVVAAAALLLRLLLLADFVPVPDRTAADSATPVDAPAGAEVVAGAASVLAATSFLLRALLLAGFVLVAACAALDSKTSGNAPAALSLLLLVGVDFLSGRGLAVGGVANAASLASVFASHVLLRCLSLGSVLPEGFFGVEDDGVSKALANASAAALLLAFLPDLGLVAAGSEDSRVGPACGTCWLFRVLSGLSPAAGSLLVVRLDLGLVSLLTTSVPGSCTT